MQQGYYGQQGYRPPGPYMQHPQQHQFGGPFQPPPGPPPGQYSYPQQPSGQMNQGYYNAPPPQHPQAASGPPAPPSPGYAPNQAPPMDMSREADALRAAMKGFGTNEMALITTLSRLDPLQIDGVRQSYSQRHKRNLIKDLESETSGRFRDAVIAVARGPLLQDVYCAEKAIAGLGTNEAMLNDVVLGRSNADLSHIKPLYNQTFRRTLESDVRGDLSMKTERLFTMVLAAQRNEESTPVYPPQTEADVQELYRATEGQKLGCDQVAVCSMLTSRSDGQLRAINQLYEQRFQRPLEKVLRKNFSGHMESALMFILENAVDRAKHDAWLLEDAMKGMGTRDQLLIERLVMISRDRGRLQQAKAAYRHFYKQELRQRVAGETSGDYQRMLLALVDRA